MGVALVVRSATVTLGEQYAAATQENIGESAAIADMANGVARMNKSRTDMSEPEFERAVRKEVKQQVKKSNKHKL